MSQIKQILDSKLGTVQTVAIRGFVMEITGELTFDENMGSYAIKNGVAGFIFFDAEYVHSIGGSGVIYLQ